MSNYVSLKKSSRAFAIIITILFVGLAIVGLVITESILGLYLATLIMIPLTITLWFIFSLVRYIRAKKRGGDDIPALRTRLAVAVALFVFLVVQIALLISFFAMSIMFM